MQGVRVFGVGAAVAGLLIVGAFAPLAATERGSSPEAVSPSPPAGLREALVEARCPTYSWSGVEGAREYELVVLAVPEGGVEDSPEPRVVTRATLSGDARGWTPSLGSCLERGGQYAWSVRASTPAGEGAWSEPALFRVAPGPSVEEVDAAIEILRRFVADERHEGEATADAAAKLERRAEARSSPVPKRPLGAQGQAGPELAHASAPVLGSPSISVSSNIALGEASNLFKDGAVFLWDDDSGNTSLGRHALATATGSATNNTAVGRGALESTTPGVDFAYFGSYNTAVGDQALTLNTTGHSNTATGAGALASNTTGHHNTARGAFALHSNTTGRINTATGTRALYSNTEGSVNTATGSTALFNNTTGLRNTAHGASALYGNITGGGNTALGDQALSNNPEGSRNVAIGYRAGRRLGYGYYSNEPGLDDNIFIANEGAFEDRQTIRIGNQEPGNALGAQTRAFIGGIHGAILEGGKEQEVCVDDAGQLGPCAVSSLRFKQEIAELAEHGPRILSLRPVSFRYRPGVLGGPEVPRIGLIAEEVAETFPELVTRDREGRPATVRYHLLSVLLLDELQREHPRRLAHERELADHRQELAALRERISALECGGARPSKPSWWRRRGTNRSSP